MRHAIVDKLDQLLRRNARLIEEAHALYVLVELRKLLEHDRNDGTHRPGDLILRFYADWAVHVAKDRMTPAIVEAVGDLFSATADALTRGEGIGSIPDIVRFGHMELLRSAMASALEAYGVVQSVTSRGWPSFVRLLASILSDQPLENPIDDVRAVIFHPAQLDGAEIQFTMKLRSPLQGRDSLVLVAPIT